MNKHNYIEHTKDEIIEILSTIKKSVKDNNFKISYNMNRQENIIFIKNYNINRNKQKNILENIEFSDYCYSVKNNHSDYKDEILHIFCPIVNLYEYLGNSKRVTIYIKFNIINEIGKDTIVVISFHEANKKVKYKFK